MAIGSNPLRSTRKSAQIDVISSATESITLLTLTAVALTVARPQAAAAQQTAPASAPAVFDVTDRSAIFVAHGVEVAGWGLHPLESAALSRRPH